MHETIAELTIRTASRSDRLAVCTLLHQAGHSAGGARWDQLNALEAGCATLLACRGSQAVGLCLFDLRPAPVARLSAVAVADGEDVGAAWNELWPAAERYLADSGVQLVHHVGEAPWLLEALIGQGFEQVNTVLGYEKLQDGGHLLGHPRAHLRPVGQSDLAAVAEIDAASFPLLWRYPRRLLEAAMQPTARFTLAELDRRPVGYQLSTQEGTDGQVIRLAVLPDQQRQGIGSRLLADTLAAFWRGCARRISLNTQNDNLPAQRLYERFGFQRTGEDLPVLAKVIGR